MERGRKDSQLEDLLEGDCGSRGVEVRDLNRSGLVEKGELKNR